ncbi:hypothetical protein BCON_0461g00010 [Botryotinia convoluta]|uniref:Uncharacterized protein n=1 Tax=Botryotinia convoluta TaxID=54673 RepID=A0A4Z1HDP0_9HELO|nr:hypothetical protein BCON_0461g00010 [Botryotinia convoluta]
MLPNEDKHNQLIMALIAKGSRYKETSSSLAVYWKNIAMAKGQDAENVRQPDAENALEASRA